MACVIAIMQNDRGDFLLQKRSVQKGGTWAFTGGHLEDGEERLFAIVREVKEELGLTLDPKDFNHFYNNERAGYFHIVGDFDVKQENLAKAEVQQTAWFTRPQIDDLIKSNKFFDKHLPCLDIVDKFL